MISDETYLRKGIKRKIFDKLFTCRLYGVIVLWIFRIKKIYF